VSRMDELARAFCECSLPKAEWAHHAHLRVGLWHLLRFPLDEALGRLQDGIRRYNESCGVANTEASGHRETITRFYVWVIGRSLAGADRARPADGLADELIWACGDKGLPLRYWSKERLLSAEARLGWVGPDLGALA